MKTQRSGYPDETELFIVVSDDKETQEMRKVRKVVQDDGYDSLPIYYPALESGEAESEPTIRGVLIYSH